MLETKLVCNMACKFCVYPLIEGKGVELASEEIYRIIDSVDADDDNLEAIYFQKYSEPLLDKRIFDLLKYAKESGFKTQIITNGLLFQSEDMRHKLINAEPTYITISLQTINKDLFKNSRGIENYAFEDYIQGIFKFLESSLNNGSKSKITLDIACNFLSNEQQIIKGIIGIEQGDPTVPDMIQDIQEDLINLLKKLNNYNSSFACDESKVKRYLGTIERNYLSQDELPLAKNISIKIKQFIYVRKLTEFYPILKTTGCSTKMLSISANGSVAPCCLTYNNMLNMGNIKEESLKQILDRNKDFIKGIKNGSRMPETCRRCEGAPTRRGVLALSAYRALQKRL